MDDYRESRITFSDRMDNGIVVGFDDGMTALFSAALLHDTLPQAKMIPADTGRGLPHEQEP